MVKEKDTVVEEVINVVSEIDTDDTAKDVPTVGVKISPTV